MTDAQQFAAYLEAAMTAAGKSQADLARAAKVPPSVVSRWLRGAQPSVENLRLLSPALRVPVRDLVVAAGHMRPEEVGLLKPPPPPGAPDLVEAIMAQDWLPAETKRAMVTLLGELQTGYERESGRPAEDNRASGR